MYEAQGWVAGIASRRRVLLSRGRLVTVEALGILLPFSLMQLLTLIRIKVSQDLLIPRGEGGWALPKMTNVLFLLKKNDFPGKCFILLKQKPTHTTTGNNSPVSLFRHRYQQLFPAIFLPLQHLSCSLVVHTFPSGISVLA